jgi:hypothetical protein
MLFTLTVFAIHNLFMLGLLIHEKLNYVNQQNSPLGDNINAIITAYNFSGTLIPNSSKYSTNKLSFLTNMCNTAQLLDFNYMKIVPISGSFSNKCNLTATDGLIHFNNTHVIFYLATIVASMVILFGVLIFQIAEKCSSFKITYKSVYPTMFIPYVLSIILILLLLYDMITVTPVIDYVISGENYYNNAHYILLWCGYIIFNVLVLIKIIYEAKLPIKDKDVYHNQNENHGLTSEGSQYF